MCRGNAFAGRFMRTGCGVILGLVTPLSTELMAAGSSYRYVEVNGIVGESGGEDSIGLSFEGSYYLGDVFYVT